MPVLYIRREAVKRHAYEDSRRKPVAPDPAPAAGDAAMAFLLVVHWCHVGERAAADVGREFQVTCGCL